MFVAVNRVLLGAVPVWTPVDYVLLFEKENTEPKRKKRKKNSPRILFRLVEPPTVLIYTRPQIDSALTGLKSCNIVMTTPSRSQHSPTTHGTTPSCLIWVIGVHSTRRVSSLRTPDAEALPHPVIIVTHNKNTTKIDAAVGATRCRSPAPASAAIRQHARKVVLLPTPLPIFSLY